MPEVNVLKNVEDVEKMEENFSDLIKGAKNARWSNEKKSGIELDVLFSHCDDYLPFHATAYDDVEYGRFLFDQASKGAYGNVGEVTPLTKEQRVNLNTRKRNSLNADAERAIKPLERAVKLGIATDAEVAALNAWEVYSVLLNRLDMAASDISWPAVPESN